MRSKRSQKCLAANIVPKLEALMASPPITLSEIRKLFKTDFATTSDILALLKEEGIAALKDGKYSFVKKERKLRAFIEEHCFEKINNPDDFFERRAFRDSFRTILSYMAPFYLGIKVGELDRFATEKLDFSDTQMLFDELERSSLVAISRDKLFLRIDPDEIGIGEKKGESHFSAESEARPDGTGAKRTTKRLLDMDFDELWECLANGDSPIDFEGDPWGGGMERKEEEDVEEDFFEEEDEDRAADDLTDQEDSDLEDCEEDSDEDGAESEGEEDGPTSLWAAGFAIFTDDVDLEKMIPGLKAANSLSPLNNIPKELVPKGKECVFVFEFPVFRQRDFSAVLKEIEKYLADMRQLITAAIRRGAETVFYLANLLAAKESDRYVAYPSDLLKALAELGSAVITYIGEA